MTSDADTAITVAFDGAVATVTLNRPESLNASNEELHGRLATVWGEVSALPDLRVVVLTGSGAAFSAGGDLGLLHRMIDDADLRDHIMTEAGVIVRALLAVPVPVIAAVNGPAVGLGASLAALCDLVVMADDAYFADPHVALGLAAGDGAVLTWPAHMGLQRAKEWILLGGRISADEAYRIGLANRVVPAADTLAEAHALAGRIAKLPPQAVRETLWALDAPVRARVADGLDEALAAETRSFFEPAFQANLSAMIARTSSS